jgi:hypothetical protein
MKTGAQFQEAIRHLLCMGRDDFEKVFGGEMRGDCETAGAYMFRKFRVEYKGDAGRFLCYLDSSNMTLLFKHFEMHNREFGA